MPLYINLRTNKSIPILTVVINGISYEATASTGFPYTLNLIFHSLNLLSTLSDNIALLSTLLLLLSPRYLPHQLWFHRPLHPRQLPLLHQRYCRPPLSIPLRHFARNDTPYPTYPQSTTPLGFSQALLGTPSPSSTKATTSCASTSTL